MVIVEISEISVTIGFEFLATPPWFANKFQKENR
jgi:hypothetical protein